MMKTRFGKFASVLAGFLACLLLFSACGKPNVGGGTGEGGSKGEGGDVGGSGEALSYEDALAAKDYEAAYKALLSNLTEENKEELKKFVCVPVSVTGNDPSKGDAFTATFTYDEKGLLIEMNVPLSRQPYKTEYSYDENGRVIEVKKIMTQSGSFDRYVYTYDEAGNKTSYTVYYGEDLQRTTEWTYNEHGDVLTEKETDSRGEESLSEYTYTYDEKGNKLTEDNTYQKDEWIYDENGNVVKKNHYYDGELDTVYTYTYDDRGRLIKERCDELDDDPEDAFWTEDAYIYDANGNRYFNYSKSNDKDLSFVYEYDDAGNATKMTRSEDGKVTMVRTYDAAGNLLSSDFTGDDRWEKIAFTYDQFGNRTSESYTNSKDYTYEYTVAYTVKYFPAGVPDNSEVLEDISATSSMRYFF